LQTQLSGLEDESILPVFNQLGYLVLFGEGLQTIGEPIDAPRHSSIHSSALIHTASFFISFYVHPLTASREVDSSKRSRKVKNRLQLKI
jgi:hypothetical protein